MNEQNYSTVPLYNYFYKILILRAFFPLVYLLPLIINTMYFQIGTVEVLLCGG